MTESRKTLLTVITESSLEKTLSQDIEELGAKGYTITDARGKGARGARDADWDYNGNIRFEVICSEPVAEAIKNHLKEKYFENFAMVTYCHPVEVMRSKKFS